MLLFRIIFTWPAYLLIVCLLGAVAFALLLYFRDKKAGELSPAVRNILLGLRLVFIFLLGFFLLEPMLRHVSVQKEKPVLLIAADNSQSVILSPDSAWVKNQMRGEFAKLEDELSDRFEVKKYFFDHAIHSGDTMNFSGRETDFSVLFNEIENNYANRNLGAVLIASDGLYNKGLNPLYANRNLEFPVYTLALGDTTEKKDLLVRRIVHNQVAYMGNQFPVDIVLEAKKLKGARARLSISTDNKVLQEKTVDISSDNWLQTESFSFNADRPGVRKYVVSVSYLEGESNRANNMSSFVIDVIDNREKILILAAAPHPDAGALRQSIESNKNYEVDFFLANEFKGTLKQYSLIVCHLLQWTKTNPLKNEIESAGIPYLLVSGGGTDELPALRISGPAGRSNDAEAVTNKTFSLFNISDDLKNYARNFPALKSPLGNYAPTSDMNALFVQRIGVVETENPLIYFGGSSGRKSGVILGEGIWRWRMRDFADHGNFNLFNELISKSVQYLAVKEDKSFFRVYTKKLYNENEEIEFDAEVYNNSYELITDPEVSLVIKNEEGKTFQYTFSRTNRGYHLGGIFFPPGEYSYEATVKVNQNVFSKKGLFTVRELVAERVNTVADHQLLFNLSKQSGGKLYYKNQLADLSKDLLSREEIKTVSYEEKKLNDLIDLKWIFFVLLAFISCEWFLRKRSGLY